MSNSKNFTWEHVVNHDEEINIHLLFNISHMSGLILKKRKELLSRFELEPWSYDMLVILYQSDNNGLSPKELLKLTGVTSGTMTHRINLLLKEELIISKPSSQDGRSILVVISEKGKEIIEKAIKAHAAASAEILNHLSQEEQTALQKISQKIIQTLQ
ncbi:MarR family winged helix-turn-helix transcriptional regulator [Lactococcus lactis]|uniref:MarR family winged helix-turn-helix transcriptional regulator n=1 Tax=Lactococcus lactis TaxID=1358 RepID=UPI0021AFE23B|nr:MarR family transcriptional regulator [Lactococcus lactis]MCT0068327.1 MarR family transcriptional regulator [Lactococcus lactis subsp. lactis]